MARRTGFGPKFVQYFGPVLAALNELGGSGRPEEVEDKIVEKLRISDEEQNALTETGVSRFNKQIHWARFYLAKIGFVDSSVRGVWSLTEKGRQAIPLEHQQALVIFKKVHREFQLNKTLDLDQPELIQISDTEGEQKVAQVLDYRTELLNVLRSLRPDSFERLCQRLLRESGFERVIVTGRSGDGGIDGTGVLQMTAFVSFKVLFQCKRYTDSVTPSQVRDFRGAMMGRADKGIIITTGTFTKDARGEAVRDGVPPIELVDAEKLVDLFESLKLGLKPRKAYDVDYEFFEEFK